MVLWSKFYLKDKSSLYKNLFISGISSCIMIITKNIDIYLNIALSYLSIILLIKFIYKKTFIKTLVEFVTIFTIGMVIQVILITCVNLVGFTYLDNFTWNISLLLLELFFVIIIFRCRFSKRGKKLIELESMIAYYFVINLGLYILFSKFVWEYNKNIILNNLLVYIFVLLLMLSLNIFLYYYLVKISEDKKVLEVQTIYNPILIDIVEETRRKQHDFKNYLNTINAIVEIASEKEIKQELRKYIALSKHLDKSIEDIMYIDNIVIKSIIYNKLCEADRLNIKLLFNVENGLLENSLNDYETSDILNNLLDNAFEAVIDSPKVVILNIYAEGNISVVEVRNNGITIKPESIESIFERGFSTKKGENRGYGLYNVKKIAEKNGSDVQLSFQENYTVFKILFKQTFRRSRFSGIKIKWLRITNRCLF
jgi:two-component system sensor histidine kinase AgrC